MVPEGFIYSPPSAWCSRGRQGSPGGQAPQGSFWASWLCRVFLRVLNSVNAAFSAALPSGESSFSSAGKLSDCELALLASSSVGAVPSSSPACLHHPTLVLSCPRRHLDQADPVWSFLAPSPGAQWGRWTASMFPGARLPCSR